MRHPVPPANLGIQSGPGYAFQVEAVMPKRATQLPNASTLGDTLYTGYTELWVYVITSLHATNIHAGSLRLLAWPLRGPLRRGGSSKACGDLALGFLESLPGPFRPHPATSFRRVFGPGEGVWGRGPPTGLPGSLGSLSGGGKRVSGPVSGCPSGIAPFLESPGTRNRHKPGSSWKCPRGACFAPFRIPISFSPESLLPDLVWQSSPREFVIGIKYGLFGTRDLKLLGISSLDFGLLLVLLLL